MINADEFRAVMRHWTAGVAIVTSIYEGSPHGMTVTSFTSISANPAMVSVSLAKSTRTLQRILDSGIFAVTILSDDQQWISERFAGKRAAISSRFEDVQTFSMGSGAPLIVDGLAYFECSVVHRYEMAESVLLVAEVLDIKHGTGDPLVYTDRKYGRVKLL
ncbi:MAG: flavin reductase [Anaerolineaceae bacterium]|nr:flavin reductase [Anaerolineaceae bacterium]